MGKANWGPFGPVRGKVGNLIYYYVNGRQRVRTKGKVTAPPSPNQLKARMGMRVMAGFLKLMAEFLNIGFRVKPGVNQSPFNLATSYNLVHALTGVYPDISIDFSKVMLSMGKLEGAAGLSVVLGDAGLVFSWDGSVPQFYPSPTDQTLALAYFPEQNRAVYGLYGACRLDGSVLLPIPEDLIGDRMEVYFAMVSTDRERVSDSVYLGRVN
ncbi:MAG TPA: DUF6266 family protein [Pedobacter sp.]|nr:DUF6266 family protein [Pedobacter sp.]